MTISLNSPSDTQQALAASFKKKRKQQKLSRLVAAELSTVPAPTIKRFETTGQISLRQFLLLWSCVDDIEAIYALSKNDTQQRIHKPQSIEEVINGI